MPFNEIEDYAQGKKINLTGYTSTSKSFEKALDFATIECTQE